MDKVYGKPPLQNVYEHLEFLNGDEKITPLKTPFKMIPISDAFLAGVKPLDIDKALLWARFGVRHCLCSGLLDFIYHQWWKCRECGRWFPDSDFDQAGRKELL